MLKSNLQCFFNHGDHNHTLTNSEINKPSQKFCRNRVNFDTGSYHVSKLAINLLIDLFLCSLHLDLL